MVIAIIVNQKRKDEKQLVKSNLDELAKKYELSYTLFIEDPANIEKLISKLINEHYSGFIIAGGDGTVRTAAQILVGTEIPLAILPLGTFNYFAKELNFTNDIENIFKIIKQNQVRHVDVGEVNQYIFVNHSSIGFYSHIIKMREKYQKMLGKNKFFKVIFTALNFFEVLPVYELKLKVDHQWLQLETCLIFIGNNYHFTNLLDFGNRKTLTEGLLCIYILKCKSRYDIFKCILSILFNRFDKEKYLIQYNTKELTINAKSKLINIVIDGELLKLETPLQYTIHNKKLTVFKAL